MNLTDSDLKWLRTFFPSLVYDRNAQRIVGELDFCACFDSATNKMQIEGLERDDSIRKLDSFLCDVFEIEIRLDTESIRSNGWPTVFEIGGRSDAIAKKFGVDKIDLHFYLHGDSCCLGIRHSPERNLKIKRFLYDLVIPFFYRLAYTDQCGIEAARNDLWGEYSHGDEGYREHAKERLSFALRGRGRNEPCPCGSGVKYKKCCLDEVRAVEKEAQRRRQKMSAR